MKKYLIALVMIVMIMSCFFGKTLVMANEESDDTVYNRYYTTIEVEKGDTLWSIAKTYYLRGILCGDTGESVYKVILKKMFPGYECCGKNRFLTRE